MMGKSKKLLSSLLALAMVLGLFAAMPMTARAVSSDTVIDISELWFGMTDVSIGTYANWSYNAITNTIAVTDDVTVIGNATGSSLTFVITTGKTVTWSANYESNDGVSVIITPASAGTLDVISGGVIKNTHANGAALVVSNGPAIIKISGGTVTADSASAAISTGSDTTSTITISNGTVSNTGTGNAIATGRAVFVTGGTISATAGNAIYADGTTCIVTVSGGTVSATTGIAIYANGASSVVTVNGGTVTAGGAFATISATGDVTVSGGTVTATTGTAIYAGGTSSDVKVSAGSVTAAEIAINAIGGSATVEVSGGTVESTGAGGKAITTTGASSTVTVSGGTVSTSGSDPTISTAGDVTVSQPTGSTTVVSNTGTGKAIYTDPGNVTITGGTVSAIDNDAIEADDLITISGGTVKSESTISGIVSSDNDAILSGGTVVAASISANGNPPINGTAANLYLVTITGLPNGTFASPAGTGNPGFIMDAGKAATTGYNKAWMPAAASQTYTVTSGGSTYTATGTIVAGAANNTLAFTLVSTGGGGGGGWYPPNPTTTKVPEAPKPAFPVSGQVVGKRITVYKLETLKTTLFRLNKGDTFTVVGIANNGKAFRVEKDGREGYAAFKDIGITFETPIKATAMKKAPVYSKLENGKLKRIGHYTTGQELWIHGISGKYLINKQPSITYYLDAAQWKLWLPQ